MTAHGTRRLLIGLGTGRCGTSSLRSFVDGQPGSICLHECRALESAWSGAERAVTDTIENLEALLERQDVEELYIEPGHAGKRELVERSRARLQAGEEVRVIGDIAFYYLHYIELIQDVVRVPVAFVCMQRARDEVIASYAKKMLTPGGTRNHWTAHPDETWIEDPKWDKCYPTYSARTLEAAIGQYYDDYASAARRLEEKHANFAVFDIELLNDKAGRERIMSHAGFDSGSLRHPDAPPHENASSR